MQGKGIIHAEMPVHGKNVPEPRGMQLWVDLPKDVSPMPMLLCDNTTDERATGQDDGKSSRALRVWSLSSRLK